MLYLEPHPSRICFCRFRPTFHLRTMSWEYCACEGIGLQAAGFSGRWFPDIAYKPPSESQKPSFATSPLPADACMHL